MESRYRIDVPYTPVAPVAVETKTGWRFGRKASNCIAGVTVFLGLPICMAPVFTIATMMDVGSIWVVAPVTVALYAGMIKLVGRFTL